MGVSELPGQVCLNSFLNVLVGGMERDEEGLLWAPPVCCTLDLVWCLTAAAGKEQGLSDLLHFLRPSLGALALPNSSPSTVYYLLQKS